MQCSSFVAYIIYTIIRIANEIHIFCHSKSEYVFWDDVEMINKENASKIAFRPEHLIELVNQIGYTVQRENRLSR